MTRHYVIGRRTTDAGLPYRRPMDLETVLVLAPAVSMLPLGADLSVFNAESGATLALNRTAADILALVDGATSLAQISTVVASAYEQPVPDVETVVGEVAETLLRHGAVTVGARAPA
ncbi:PqqD family protein [Pedococcus bigeumensis]|uniref:PqqD family protein n=2 Tax=Pedococcus bigeumensis TaxID=433644 RepID=A0A502D3J9_9MICO|nr:PqqD family protein [Pedococcus bigeumensis]